MDWKANVLLFVLVLFGSVVPVSAQVPPASGGTVDGVNWELLTVGLAFITAFFLGWNTLRGIAKDNRDAHEKIGKNINKVEENLKADIEKVEGNLREDVRESEKRVNENINKVHGDVRLLLEHALREKSDGSAKD